MLIYVHWTSEQILIKTTSLWICFDVCKNKVMIILKIIIIINIIKAMVIIIIIIIILMIIIKIIIKSQNYNRSTVWCENIIFLIKIFLLVGITFWFIHQSLQWSKGKWMVTIGRITTATTYGICD